MHINAYIMIAGLFSSNYYPVVFQSSMYFLLFLMVNVRLSPTIYCHASINNICWFWYCQNVCVYYAL